jgi:hypothetical protein
VIITHDRSWHAQFQVERRLCPDITGYDEPTKKSLLEAYNQIVRALPKKLRVEGDYSYCLLNKKRGEDVRVLVDCSDSQCSALQAYLEPSSSDFYCPNLLLLNARRIQPFLQQQDFLIAFDAPELFLSFQ